MNKKTAFIFPGQGAQYPGMGKDFFDKYSEARAVFEKADEILDSSFSKLIFEGPKEELTQTKNSQLAIFIVSIAILEVFKKENSEIIPSICAGLSLGEYTALVAAGKLSFEEALLLVKTRGALMQEACVSHPGTMKVVLGLELSKVKEALIDGVWIANLNCPGQIVISGEKEALEKMAIILKEKGAKRVLPLDVSGAFHSGLMQTAQDGLTPKIEASEITSSPIQVAMNVPGSIVISEEEMRQNMINQVTSPVLWQKDVETMVSKGIELFIEMGPGKTLSGMNKRIGVTQPTISIEKVEDLQYAITQK